MEPPQSIVERHLAESEAALAALERQRDALDRQRDDLLAEISALRDVLARRRANGSVDFQPPPVEPLQPFTPPVEPLQPFKRDEPRIGSKRHRIEVALEKLIQEHGTMHRQHLFERLKEQGLIGDERSPLANLSNVLSVSGKFRTLGSGIWGLAQTDSQPDTRTAG